ncbi:MAG: hypothetical protein JWN15_1852 [Firmicutes bacterium]|nr:hypothetical protein [Bacillota bacterium]
MRIKRRALRRRDEIPRTEAFTVMSQAAAKGRRAIRRIVLKRG